MKISLATCLFVFFRGGQAGLLDQGATCDVSNWPDLDHGLVCGDCKALITHMNSKYITCESYCNTIGRGCSGAWEEQNDNCQVKSTQTCSHKFTYTTDAICACGPLTKATTTTIPATTPSTTTTIDPIATTTTTPVTTLATSTTINPIGATCDVSNWPDLDHGLVCGDCKALITHMNSKYITCESYCNTIGRGCSGAWEEQNDNCQVKSTQTCSHKFTYTTDAICACGPLTTGNQEVMDKLTMLENKIANLETENENMKDLTMLENKIANLETENENMKDLTILENKIANLETENENMKDLMKVTVLRSCAEYSHYGLQTSGRYLIDPDGKLAGQEPFQVYCDFSSGVTEVFHDTETVTEIEQCHDPGCYNKKVAYINGLTTETINMNQILSLMELSESCTQDIRYDCTQAPLERNGVNYAWWKGRNGEENIYFTGSHYNQHVCDCHYSPDGCVNAELEKNQCNCNAYQPVATSDTGTITNMSALPIMEMFAGGLEHKQEVGSFQIGRLKCYGEKEVEAATSCSSLKREGVRTSGYYNIKLLGSNHVKLVFCDMKTDTYNDVLQIEESDGSPLGTISAWVSKPAGDGSPEQLPYGWVLCDGSLIEKGIWAGARTPDLNSGHFLRGGNLGQQLQMEEDQLQDHKHTDPGHSHTASSTSTALPHDHSYTDNWNSDADSGGSSKYCDGYPSSCGDWDSREKLLSTTGSSTVSVSTSTSVNGQSTGVSGVTSSYRHGAETRPKNMKVSWIMKCW